MAAWMGERTAHVAEQVLEMHGSLLGVHCREVLVKLLQVHAALDVTVRLATSPTCRLCPGQAPGAAPRVCTDLAFTGG